MLRVLLAWGAFAVAVVAAIGCGGSSDSSSSAAAQEPLSTSTHLGPPSVQGGSQGDGQFSGRSGQRKFQALTNTICGTVRSGAPPPLSRSAKDSALRDYAAAAARVNSRTITSLQRLGAPQSLRKQLERLLGSLLQLQTVYEQVSSGQPPNAEASATRRSIAMAEARANTNALAAGVPACAPPFPIGGGAH